jgi:hypothetical protein
MTTLAARSRPQTTRSSLETPTALAQRPWRGQTGACPSTALRRAWMRREFLLPCERRETSCSPSLPRHSSARTAQAAGSPPLPPRPSFVSGAASLAPPAESRGEVFQGAGVCVRGSPEPSFVSSSLISERFQVWLSHYFININSRNNFDPLYFCFRECKKLWFRSLRGNFSRTCVILLEKLVALDKGGGDRTDPGEINIGGCRHLTERYLNPPTHKEQPNKHLQGKTHSRRLATSLATPPWGKLRPCCGAEARALKGMAYTPRCGVQDFWESVFQDAHSRPENCVHLLESRFLGEEVHQDPRQHCIAISKRELRSWVPSGI